jgi:hypothetical protein
VLHQRHLRGALLTVLTTSVLCAPLVNFTPVLMKNVFGGGPEGLASSPRRHASSLARPTSSTLPTQSRGGRRSIAAVEHADFASSSSTGDRAGRRIERPCVAQMA